MATGLIVGESLFGVVFAGIVAASGTDSPLALVGEGFESWGQASASSCSWRSWRAVQVDPPHADDMA